MTRTLSSIQFLRFVAAFVVCIHHAHTATAVHGLMLPAAPWVKHLTDVGAAGVHIFFVISGFIMVYTVFGKAEPVSPRDFLIRRGLRIFPIYWIVCALSLIAAAGGFITYAFGIGGLFASLLLLPGASSLIVGPGWTLSFELYFYLCFAVVMVTGRTRAIVLLSAFFFMSIMLGALLRPSNAFLKVATSHLLLEFLAGAAIGLLYLSRHSVPAGLAKLAVAVAGMGFLASVSADDLYPTVLVWGAPSALLVFGLAMWEKAGAMPAAVDRGAPLGGSSYLLYLIHTLVFDVTLKLLLSLGAAPEFGWLWISLVVGLSVVVAIVMHERVEKPLNSWLARLLLRRNKGRESGRVQAA